MVKAILKSTSNASMQRIVGIEGQLEVGTDGRFHFRFVDESNQKLDLSSSIARQMGSLENPASKEVCFETHNSTYVFEKRENVREGLFDWTKN